MARTPQTEPPPYGAQPGQPPAAFDLTRWRAESLWALVATARQLASIRRTLEEVQTALRHVAPVVLALAVLAEAA
jgi:hypothetical protein